MCGCLHWIEVCCPDGSQNIDGILNRAAANYILWYLSITISQACSTLTLKQKESTASGQLGYQMVSVSVSVLSFAVPAFAVNYWKTIYFCSLWVYCRPSSTQTCTSGVAPGLLRYLYIRRVYTNSDHRYDGDADWTLTFEAEMKMLLAKKELSSYGLVWLKWKQVSTWYFLSRDWSEKVLRKQDKTAPSLPPCTPLCTSDR
jgi:hypothetical protein